MADRSGRFAVHGRDLSAFFTSKGFALSLRGGPKEARKGWGLLGTLVNGREVSPVAERARQEVVHRYVGETSAWQTGVPTFDQVAWEEVVPGVDMIAESGGDGLSYGFVLSPGAKVSDLAMRWEGATGVRVGADGAEILTGLGALRLRGLRAYEIVGRERHELSARWVAERDELGLSVDGWSGERPLVIDPTLEWSRLIGGDQVDDGFGIAADASGNVVVVGETTSATFPTTGGFDTTLGGFEDAFATKYSGTGARLWSTYLGGTQWDRATAVAETGSEFVLTGRTDSTDFPTKDAASTALSGVEDAFVTRLSAAGSLVFSTYLGGAKSDVAVAVATGPDGSVVVVGRTESTDFPTKAARDATLDGTSDGFVTKLTGSGALTWSSYLGGSSSDEAWAVAVDKLGNVVVGGMSLSSDYPIAAGYDTTFGGGAFADGVITKLTPAGAITWSTFLGGADGDGATSVAIDASGDILVVGQTGSADFPVKDAFEGSRGTLGTAPIAFVSKLRSDGGLSWSSYLRCAGESYAKAVAVDATGDALVVGYAYGDGLPLAQPFDSTFAGANEGFVARVSSAGKLVRSSYLGGTYLDVARAVATDPAGNTFVAGFTTSPDFPGGTWTGAKQEVFVTKLPRPSAGGAACAEDIDCMSAICTDGVCCDRRCTSACEACSAAKKGSGADGTCGFASAGTDPGLRCAQVICDDGVIYQPKLCDGAGACRATTSTSCGLYNCGYSPYWCGTTMCGWFMDCGASCSVDAACTKAAWCDAGGCQPDRSNGSTCERNEQCLTNLCVDGVCCDKPCAGGCESCLASATGLSADGTCAPVLAGTDPRASCTADPGYPASCKADGACDGSGKCRSYATSSTSCGTTTCADGKVTGNLCAGDSSACLLRTTSCAPYACGTNACKTNCTSDADCSATAYCTGSVCVSKGALGASCSETRECLSGFCADGVCCNSACSNQCEYCNATPGTCTTVTGAPRGGRAPCAGAATACAGSCNGLNVTCTFDPTKVCASSCAGGSRTASLCTTAGACVAGAPASCGGYRCDAAGVACRASCATDADCTVDAYCTPGNTCTPKLANGSGCSDGRQCSSTFCTDGVCCNAACAGQCESCNEVATKGTCTAISGAPHTGRPACAGAGTACAGKCDGVNGGTCAFDTTKVCATSCAAGSKTESRCDAAGACKAGPVVSCGGYGCATETACRTSCAGDGDCAADSYCSGTSCTAKVGLGKACKDGRECGSGFCADGVCCTGPCRGNCESCVEEGKIGECKPVAGSPRAGHPACGTAPCAGTCDGINGATCTYKRDPCGATCAANVETLSFCDETGACRAQAPTPCAKFVCDSATTGCKTSCTKPSDCQASYACVGGDCLPAAASCSADGLASVNNAGERTDCLRYRCDRSSFRCRSTCETIADCSPGNICTSQSACEPPPVAADEGGCSCEATPHPRGLRAGWLALLTAAAVTSRRRRRDQRGRTMA